MQIQGNELLAIFYVFGMAGGMFVIFLAMKQRSETLERQHRERMAMIERGQVPPPPPVRRGTPSVAMSLGIVVVGLGLGLMTLISIAGGSPDVGVGVGGSIVIVGAAFIVRSLVVRPPAPSTPAIPPPPEPPSV